MADIFKEIDEEVRRDKALELWRKIGPYCIGLAVLVIVGVAGYKGWTYYQEQKNLEQSDTFAQAVELMETGEEEQASSIFGDLADPGGSGYELLAAFERARLLAKSGDLTGALSIWDAIISSDNAGEGFKGAATLLSVMHQLEGGDTGALKAKLEPLASQGQAFRPGALELLAVIALKENDREEALRLYRELADELTAPAAMRARAVQMLEALEG